MKEKCKNCDTELNGKYCHQCGQKVITAEDKKLSHLILEFVHHLTHLDGKFLKTLRTVLFNPGIITREVTYGITAPHFKISALFVVGTIIYFLLPSQLVVGTPMNQDYLHQTDSSEYSRITKPIAERKMARENISKVELSKRYDIRAHDFGKLLILLLVPLILPVMWLINLWIKLFKRKYSINAFDLGIASLEINCIILYGFLIMGGLILRIVRYISLNETLAITVMVGITLALTYQIFRFFRTAYSINWWQSVVCVCLLMVGYIYMMKLYGLISFFILV